MQSAGITIGLGHDGAESNNSRDLFEVMKFASLIQRATQIDASLLTAHEVLEMATVNGAKALGTGGGAIIPGATADLTVIDLNDLTFTPLSMTDAEQLAAHLVYSATGANVHTVIVDGQVVMSNHQHTQVDEKEIRENANKCFARVLAKASAQ